MMDQEVSSHICKLTNKKVKLTYCIHDGMKFDNYEACEITHSCVYNGELGCLNVWQKNINALQLLGQLEQKIKEENMFKCMALNTANNTQYAFEYLKQNGYITNDSILQKQEDNKVYLEGKVTEEGVKLINKFK